MSIREVLSAATSLRNVTRGALFLGFVTATALALVRTMPANAYDTWSTNGSTGKCATCHGDFRAANYVSKNDGVAWNTSLHIGHRTTMLSGDCNTCHLGSGRTPVDLNRSNGGTGLAAISCSGCHARSEPAAGGAVMGASLRQHHWNAGEQGCAASGCHADANPANFVTAAESVKPPYYFTPDAAHPNKPTSPCNTNGSESPVAPPLGLDNNGNNIYDGSDPTCSTAAVDLSPGLAVLQLDTVRPNPSFGRLRVTFSLASSRPASIELLDVTGRRVMQQEIGQLGAGRHAMDLDSGRPIAPGVYMVRLMQDGKALSTSAIVRR